MSYCSSFVLRRTAFRIGCLFWQRCLRRQPLQQEEEKNLTGIVSLGASGAGWHSGHIIAHAAREWRRLAVAHVRVEPVQGDSVALVDLMFSLCNGAPRAIQTLR